MIDLSRTTVLLELWRVSRRARSAMDDAFGDAELDPSEFGLYSMLLVDGPLTVTQAARRSGMPVTTTSQALRRVEDRGHLEREPNPDDGRSTVVTLNDAGRAAHREAGGRFRPLLQRVNAALGPELGQVAFSLVRLDHVLREVTGEAVEDPVPARPANASTHTLTYAGDALTSDEQEEAREFIAWLRHRRSVLAAAADS